MNRIEVMKQVSAQRTAEHCFIKTWSAGQKFVDYDLIDRFAGKPDQDAAIEGYELLDIEQMWQTLIDLDPDKLLRVKSEAGEVIEWLWIDAGGNEKKTVYSFTPEGIMTIVDDEFFS